MKNDRSESATPAPLRAHPRPSVREEDALIALTEEIRLESLKDPARYLREAIAPSGGE